LSVDKGFDQLQSEVDVPRDVMREARRRRDLFRSALPKVEDVTKVIPTGSLARGTHKDPLHDVDLVCLFKADAHPEWGQPGASADAALEHTRGLVTDLLGHEDGSEGREVRLIRKQNHALRCFLDDPDEEDPFTVDVAPALRHPESGLLIPQQRSSDWIRTDPEYLMELVAKRHAEWNQFAKLVRALKRWSADRSTGMKSLVVEVLALYHMPDLGRAEALARFFAAASGAIWKPVEDPAGLCGEIQPDMDRDKANSELSNAADVAWRAVDAAGRGETDRAMCLWREIFDDIYPEPSGGCGTAKAPGLIVAPALRPKRRVVDAPQG
jgi:hypothetical protein